MIDKLEMLIALAREKHFGRAAELCHVTQPTLSSGIKSLEDQLGAQLVQRGPRFIGLTPEGERVLARARVMLAEAKAMKADLAAARRSLSGALRIGVIPTMLAEARAYTAPFLARHPAARLSIRSMASREILDALADFGIDAGLSYAETDLSHDRIAGLEALPLYEERYALLAAEGAELPDPLGWPDLARLPLGLLTPDMQNRRIVERRLAEAGAIVEPRLESNSVLALVSHVAEARIATILPARTAEFFARLPGIASRPIREAAGPADSAVALILPPAGRRGLLLDAFVRSVEADRKRQ